MGPSPGKPDFHPSHRDLRILGLLLPLFFGMVGGLVWRGSPVLFIAGIAAAAGLLLSLLFNDESARRYQMAGLFPPALFLGAGFAGGPAPVPTAVILWAAGVLAAAAVFAAEGVARRLYTGWMLAAAPAGWAISRVLLAVVYFVALLPIALIMRATGRDALQRELDRDRSSYWTDYRGDDEVEGYFRQF
jgi:hypothetical protein